MQYPWLGSAVEKWSGTVIIILTKSDVNGASMPLIRPANDAIPTAWLLHHIISCLTILISLENTLFCHVYIHHNHSLGPFYRSITVPSVTRCRCRRRCCRCRHRCAGGVRSDSSDTWWMAMRRAAARSGEWAQHFSNASCLYHLSSAPLKIFD